MDISVKMIDDFTVDLATGQLNECISSLNTASEKLNEVRVEGINMNKSISKEEHPFCSSSYHIQLIYMIDYTVYVHRFTHQKLKINK